MIFRVLILLFVVLLNLNLKAQQNDMSLIKGGIYLPMYGSDTNFIKINDFYLDTYPVTNKEYIEFLKDNPKWRKSNIIALFADENYLEHFKSDLELESAELPNGPIRNVSWYAAKNYCESKGKRLATMDEWEYVARADENTPDAMKSDKYNKYILSWYESSKTYHQPVGSTFKNYWGVYDMHGLVWEWTQDFSSVLMSGEGRNDLSGNNTRFCGGAIIGATDLQNYAAFMRYAFRGSLKAKYSVRNLGFRCAKSIK